MGGWVASIPASWLAVPNHQRSGSQRVFPKSAQTTISQTIERDEHGTSSANKGQYPDEDKPPIDYQTPGAIPVQKMLYSVIDVSRH